MKDTAATNPKQGNAATNQNDPVPTCFDGNATTTDSTAIYHSVWYTITPQASGNVTVSTDGSRYDTRAYVFTGTPASPNPVACNDDSTTVSTTGAAQSDIGAFAVTSGAGLTYWIMASEAPKPVGTLLDANGDPVISSGNLVNDIIPSSPHPVLNLAVTGSGLTPSPTSLAFGAQVVNTTSTSKTLTLKATNASLSSIAPSITGDYALAGGTCVSTLSQNSTCTILVTFTPTVLGSRAGTLTVPSSGILGPLKVSLTGTGATVLSTSPISLSFGTVYVGKNATLSGKLTNNSASSLPITAAIAPAGTDFSLGTTTCGASLASHTSCSFQVVFTPTSQRNETASLTYTSGVNKATVSLRGTAMYALALSSKTIAFGTITVNTSLLQTVTLTNNTASSITLSNGISPTGTAFSISGGTCGTTLAAHTACTIGVLFAPKTTGLQSATLNVSGGGYANSATLTGTGQ